ncbi:MAG: GNAT family N-acetyltransferase [Chloroflexi bacterium]|nr:GNAT family N-acetyltransferase [Chloroflexota bacterium]
MTFSIEGPYTGQAAVCEPILRALPAWFGIEDAIVHYVEAIEGLPTLLAYQSGQVIGFLSLQQHNVYAAEVYVMGVQPEAHRQGVGQALMQQAETFLRQQQIEYLQVKTLASSHPDPNYAKTRTFYLAVGFRPLEELPQLWGEQNPCLIMIKRL